MELTQLWWSHCESDAVVEKFEVLESRSLLLWSEMHAMR